MQKPIASILCLISGFCFAAPIPASSDADVDAHRLLVERALSLDRVPEMLAQQEQSARLRVQNDPRVSSLPADERQRLTEIIIKAMDMRRALADITDEVVLRSEVAALQTFNEAYSTPVAVKLNGFSIQSADPVEMEKLKDFVAQFESSPPRSERVRQIVRLDELTHASEIMAENMLVMTMRMSRVEPGSARHQQMKDKVREWATDQTLVMILFGLRQASDDELKAYVDLHENRAVSEITSVIIRAVMNSVQSMIDRIVEATVLEASSSPKGIRK